MDLSLLIFVKITKRSPYKIENKNKIIAYSQDWSASKIPLLKEENQVRVFY